MSGSIAQATLVPSPVAEQLVSLEEANRLFQRLIASLPNNPQFLDLMVNALAERGIKACSGGCGLPSDSSDCTIDTRLSYSRVQNLKRQNGDEFAFSELMPLQPGQSATYTIPSFPLGRVIECFYFRPTMGQNGNPDDIKVTITGEDNVLWKKFRGGRHASQGCCLLECFANDCIGWDEGFNVILEHTGAQGSPPLLSAVADWNYLFPGSQSGMIPGWCWPKGRCGSRC